MYDDPLSRYLGVKPVKIDKQGPMYSARDVNLGIAAMIGAGTYFKRRVRLMTADLEQASKTAADGAEKFNESLNKFLAVEKRFVDESKKASGSVRDAAEKLGQGMLRIEKAANFDRLERYVLLLERAAAAMQTLAELQSSGKLEKIAEAVK